MHDFQKELIGLVERGRGDPGDVRNLLDGPRDVHRLTRVEHTTRDETLTNHAARQFAIGQGFVIIFRLFDHVGR